MIKRLGVLAALCYRLRTGLFFGFFFFFVLFATIHLEIGQSPKNLDHATEMYTPGQQWEMEMVNISYQVAFREGQYYLKDVYCLRLNDRNYVAVYVAGANRNLARTELMIPIEFCVPEPE